MVATALETDLCTCDVCKHHKATTCYSNGCTCCKEMDEEYLNILANDEMRD
jgi:hypothetical protein